MSEMQLSADCREASQIPISWSQFQARAIQPIINQHWNHKWGRKRSASSLDVRTGQLIFDLHPIKVNVTPVRAGRFICTDHHRIAPVITIDFFSAAKRIDVYDYIHSSKLIRLYFSPTQFRAPLNLDKAWKCDSFSILPKMKFVYNTHAESVRISSAGAFVNLYSIWC